MQSIQQHSSGRPRAFKEAMKKYSLTLPPSVMEPIQKLADNDRRSLSAYLSILLFDYVKKLDETNV